MFDKGIGKAEWQLAGASSEETSKLGIAKVRLANMCLRQCQLNKAGSGYYLEIASV
jgi:hypothetical protein